MALFGVAAVVVVLARQLMPRKLSWLFLLGVPAALAVVGLRQAPSALSAAQGLDLALECALATACGLWQGNVTRVYQQDGAWYLRSGWSYVVAWVLFLVGDTALQGLILGPASLANGSDMWISLLGAAIAWGMRALIIARQTGLVPPAQGAVLAGHRGR
jgi:hypothetical protein